VWSADGAPAESRNGGYASRELFAVAGVPPALGRGFLAEDELPGAPPVVVLSAALWRERYGADPEVLGRSVRIGGSPATVVGVMPPGFQFPLRQEYWLPLEPLLESVGPGVRLPLQVVGRLRQGVPAERAAAALDAVADRVAADAERVQTVVTPFLTAYTAGARRPLWLATAAAVGVLLIACANVANLLLARGLARSGELAVRAALGAGRRRIAGELLSEAAALALFGGAAGLGVAWAAIRLYRAAGGLVGSFWVDIRLDLPSLLVVGAATALSALAAGSVPALRASRLAGGRALAGHRGTSGLRLGLLARGLVVAQVALSCTLLVGTGLLLESVRRLHAHDLGEDPEAVWVGAVTPGVEGADPARWLRFYDELQARVEAIPGTAAAGWASHLPAGRTPPAEVEVEGEEAVAGRRGPSARLAVIGPGYFRALGRPLDRGRDLAATDREGAEPVALVNRSFAEGRLGGDAVGRRIRLVGPGGAAGPWMRVVGIAPDLFLDWSYFEARIGPGRPAGVYVPLAQSPLPGMTLLVRSSRRTGELTPEIRAALAALDPGVPLLRAGTLADSIADATSPYRTVRTLLGASAAIALALAGLGLFGVLACSVGERRRELGIRSALGARRWDLASLIARSAGTQVGLGLLAGLGLGWLVSRALEGLLFEVEPWEPRVFLGVALALAAVAAAASFLPVRRAARLDPAAILRGD
jgi:putative ABC transport system permease protein